MPYATLEDIVERAGSAEVLDIADRDGDGIADPGVIAAALATAGQTIDGYLGVRFQLPLAAVPPLVAKWAVSIARYHLHRDGPPDHVVRDYKDALSELRDAGAGRLALPGADGIAPPSGTSDRVISGSDPRAFTDQAFEGFR